MDLSGSAVGLSRAGGGGRRSKVLVRSDSTPALAAIAQRIDQATHKLESAAGAARRVLKLHPAEKRVKLEWNDVQGHHLRVTKRDQPALNKKEVAQALPGKRVLSTQKSGALFTTTALAEAAEELSAQEQRFELEQGKRATEIVAVASTYARVLAKIGGLLSLLDVLVALAETAATEQWCRPMIVSDSSSSSCSTSAATATTASSSSSSSTTTSVSRPLAAAVGCGAVFEADELRHPVVEAALELRGGGGFVPNNVRLGAVAAETVASDELATTGRLAIITGPNCGGKSTLLASVGIAQLLAQIGSFVPARRARLSLCRRLVARVGASDAPTRGVSTFMAEMLDTRTMLQHAGPHTLALVDELGRGTSTSEGFGIAWAVAEALVRSGGLALFATHFHELTALEQQASPGQVSNQHVTADTSNGDVVFLFEARAGPCDRSFGVHVARLANFPPEVVAHAQSLANQLEQASTTAAPAAPAAMHPEQQPQVGGLTRDNITQAAVHDPNIDPNAPLAGDGTEMDVDHFTSGNGGIPKREPSAASSFPSKRARTVDPVAVEAAGPPAAAGVAATEMTSPEAPVMQRFLALPLAELSPEEAVAAVRALLPAVHRPRER